MQAIPFQPINTSSPPFSTPIVLDNQSMLLSVTWNTAAQRWYVTLSSSATIVWVGPLIASAGVVIALAPSVTGASTLWFDDTSQQFEATP